MESPALLKKMLELEETQEHLKQEMSRLKVSTELRQPSHSPRRKNRIQGSMNEPSPGKFTNNQYLNILQSMAQSVHVLDLNTRIIFWNTMSEKLYGYSAAEVVGQNPTHVIVDDRDAAFAMNVARRCLRGESWTGEFPVKRKSGEIFPAVTTCSPFYDANGSLIGIISITSNTAPYRNRTISLGKLKAQEGETSSGPARNSFASKLGLESKGAVISKLGLNSHQPIQVAIASKISDLVSNKVRSKMRAGDNSATLSDGCSGVFNATLADHRDDAASSCATTPRGDFIQSPFGVFTYNDEKFPSKAFKDSSDENDGKPAIHKVEKGFSWPWKGNDEQEGSKGKPTHSVWPWGQNEQDKDQSHQISPSSGVHSESHASESQKPTDNEASSLWSSSTNANSTSSGSTNSSVMNKIGTDSYCLEYEILWDDLAIGEQIGQGSCGTVYHGLWFGSVRFSGSW
ncbi:hypothetical protein V5N11_023852 [Cardamine amara subsp. amara]|uniref:PAS domain-containing protein n=1 Tax=Cardamine amara subsp. amara TaxID=228776 RepID=A0ABD1BG25_CARAN